MLFRSGGESQIRNLRTTWSAVWSECTHAQFPLSTRDFSARCAGAKSPLVLLGHESNSRGTIQRLHLGLQLVLERSHALDVRLDPSHHKCLDRLWRHAIRSAGDAVRYQLVTHNAAELVGPRVLLGRGANIKARHSIPDRPYRRGSAVV